ncbi:hypothetical protein MRX96_038695 [Rhipicephalus microplus]
MSPLEMSRRSRVSSPRGSVHMGAIVTKRVDGAESIARSQRPCAAQSEARGALNCRGASARMSLRYGQPNRDPRAASGQEDGTAEARKTTGPEQRDLPLMPLSPLAYGA